MSESEFVELKRKVEQHEKAIVQLLEIIAHTNQRLSEIKMVSHV